MTQPDLETHRPLLFSIAYRMLGTTMEAEDIVQEAYLRYQQADPQAIQSPRAYLSTIVTRLCINELNSAKQKRELYTGPWLPEPVNTAAHPELMNPAQRASINDSISMAFMVLLEQLSPAERAVFILREIFDYDYGDIAKTLEKSESACRKVVQPGEATPAR